MPLKMSPSKAAFQFNLRELLQSGQRSRKQALAIALRVQRGERRKARSPASGGSRNRVRQ